jgi:hypothetical protein
MRSGRLPAAALLLLTSALLWLAMPAGAGAKSKVLKPVSYPGMTTYSCRTAAIDIHPGQNLNLFSQTKTCPNAQVVSGPGGADVFSRGSEAEGYVTRFRPSMVEIKGGGELVTPSVWDLHLHHVVWLAPGGGPTFASGEEKTVISLPQGYGLPAGGDDRWGLNYMIHNLTAAGGRQVYVTWEIDWVPVDSPSGAGIEPARVQWLDVAGRPQIYPVFDAERGFDTNGDGKFVFPDEVPDDPAAPGFEERRKITSGRFRTAAPPWCPASVTSTPAGSTCASRWRGTVPTPGRSTATGARRSASCSAPTPSTTSPRAP